MIRARAFLPTVSLLAFIASSPIAGQAPASAAPQSPRDACALLTKDDVKAVFGGEVREPVSRESGCLFESTRRGAPAITLRVRWTGGEAAMEGVRLAARAFRDSESLSKTFGHDEKDVRDLGDDASFPLKTLSVLKGDVLIELDASRCSRAQAIALARKALARLQIRAGA